MTYFTLTVELDESQDVEVARVILNATVHRLHLAHDPLVTVALTEHEAS